MGYLGLWQTALLNKAQDDLFSLISFLLEHTTPDVSFDA
jgi:hypothetical protein